MRMYGKSEAIVLLSKSLPVYLAQTSAEGARRSGSKIGGSMLAYGEADDKYGHILRRDDEMMESLENGEDRTAWLKLVEVVQNNNKALS